MRDEMAGDVVERDWEIRSEPYPQAAPEGRTETNPEGRTETVPEARVGSDPSARHSSDDIDQDGGAPGPQAGDMVHGPQAGDMTRDVETGGVTPGVETGGVTPGARPTAAAGPDAGEADRLLADLREAGLVSHVARGTRPPGQGETATLEAMCTLIAGSIYRLDAFHYAFCLEADDVGAVLGTQPSEDWAGTLETALAGRVPGAALRIQALAARAPARAASETEAVPGSGDLGTEAALWLLRAWDGAVADGIGPAGAGTHAVINARFAAETARLTAARTAAMVAQAVAAHVEGAGGPAATDAPAADAARRLEGLETQVGSRLEGFETQVGTRLEGFETQIGTRLAGLETQIARLATGLGETHPGSDAAASGQIATLAETCAVLVQSLERVQAENAEFRRALGRAFGEFLAQIDARDLRAQIDARDLRAQIDARDRQARGAGADPLQAG